MLSEVLEEYKALQNVSKSLMLVLFLGFVVLCVQNEGDDIPVASLFCISARLLLLVSSEPAALGINLFAAKNLNWDHSSLVKPP